MITFGNLSISNQHSNICVFFANRSLKVPQSVRSGSPGSSFLRRSLSDFAPVCFISSLCLRHQCINIKGSGQKLEIDGMWKNSTLGGSRRVVKTKDHTFPDFFSEPFPNCENGNIRWVNPCSPSFCPFQKLFAPLLQSVLPIYPFNPYRVFNILFGCSSPATKRFPDLLSTV